MIDFNPLETAMVQDYQGRLSLLKNEILKIDNKKCWFCNDVISPINQKGVSVITMYYREVRGMKFRDHPGIEIIIPRCKTCAEIHYLQKETGSNDFGFVELIGWVMGLFGLLMAVSESGIGPYPFDIPLMIFFLLISTISFVVAFILLKKRNSALNMEKTKLENLIKSHPNTLPHDYYLKHPAFQSVIDLHLGVGHVSE
jgi:hypothetical protein